MELDVLVLMSFVVPVREGWVGRFCGFCGLCGSCGAGSARASGSASGVGALRAVVKSRASKSRARYWCKAWNCIVGL